MSRLSNQEGGFQKIKKKRNEPVEGQEPFYHFEDYSGAKKRRNGARKARKLARQLRREVCDE